jgi:hypothetical protein
MNSLANNAAGCCCCAALHAHRAHDRHLLQDTPGTGWHLTRNQLPTNLPLQPVQHYSMHSTAVAATQHCMPTLRMMDTSCRNSWYWLARYTNPGRHKATTTACTPPNTHLAHDGHLLQELLVLAGILQTLTSKQAPMTSPCIYHGSLYIINCSPCA